ncbi:hypothetical protein SK1NUM_02750 [Arachnia rubra]|jgi:hypothetical protein|nr:hypothetical protein SK1NUM_02750 [Arachnia rubra]
MWAVSHASAAGGTKKASEQAAASRRKADEDSAKRGEAVPVCMDARIPRQETADALDILRQTVYQIIS